MLFYSEDLEGFWGLRARQPEGLGLNGLTADTLRVIEGAVTLGGKVGLTGRHDGGIHVWS